MLLRPSNNCMASASYVFSGEAMRLYVKLAESHSHSRGPWAAILSRVAALRLPAGAHVLDLASGHGEPALTLARALPSLRITSTDVSADMVAAAGRRLGGLPNVDLRVADMCDLRAFPDDSVDCVVSCYGLMFAPDKAQALAEVHRVLKPGGCIVATYWLQLRLMALAKEVMTAVYDGPPPPLPPQNPLALREPGAFDALATGAGLVMRESSEGPGGGYPFHLGSDEEEAFRLCTFASAEIIAERDPAPHPKARAAFAAAAKAIMQPPEGDAAAPASVVPGNRFVIAVAAKPGGGLGGPQEAMRK